MQLQAIITRLDLCRFLDQLAPVALDLEDTDGPVRHALIARPDLVELVPGRGVRIVTTVHLRCKVAGMTIPVTATSTQLLLTPTIVAKDGHDELSFSGEIEAIDLRHVPHVVEEVVLTHVNKALATDQARLSWNYVKTLTFNFGMPARMHPVERITLGAGNGTVAVTEEGVFLTVFFEAGVKRGAASVDAEASEGAPQAPAPPPEVPPQP